MMENKELYKLNEVGDSTFTPSFFDYLIISLDSGEERSWKLIDELAKKNVKIGTLIVLAFGVNEMDAKARISFLSGETVDKFIYLLGEKTDYVNNVSCIRDKVVLSSKGELLGIDITCMPIPQYFLLIKWLSRKVSSLYVYYTQPERYIMNEGLFKSYFSTQGPVSVLEINGFTGVTANDDDGDRVLICMLGFDNDLLPVVIQDAGPQKIVAINGFPSFFSKFKDISLVNNQRILSGTDYASRLEKTKSLSNYFYVEANNPFEAYNVVHEIVCEHKNFCIDIVPLGTKPMALGVCMYAIVHEDIRVVFPIPEVYASSVSEKSKKTYEYILSFEKGE